MKTPLLYVVLVAVAACVQAGDIKLELMSDPLLGPIYKESVLYPRYPLETVNEWNARKEVLKTRDKLAADGQLTPAREKHINGQLIQLSAAMSKRLEAERAELEREAQTAQIVQELEDINDALRRLRR